MTLRAIDRVLACLAARLKISELVDTAAPNEWLLLLEERLAGLGGRPDLVYLGCLTGLGGAVVVGVLPYLLAGLLLGDLQPHRHTVTRAYLLGAGAAFVGAFFAAKRSRSPYSTAAVVGLLIVPLGLFVGSCMAASSVSSPSSPQGEGAPRRGPWATEESTTTTTRVAAWGE